MTMTRDCDCKHVWVEVGARRWCVRRYDEGGCGAFQVKRAGQWIIEAPKPAKQEAML